METVLLTKEGNVATITLNRPKSANSITAEMGNQLISILKTLETDNQTRVVILTGSGNYFCTGMDLNVKDSKEKLDPELLFKSLLQFPKPIISKINGPCIGGGLVFCTDIRISNEKSFFQFAEVKRGLAPAFISSFIVPQIGTFLSKDLMMTGRKMTSKEAYERNVISKVVKNEEEMNNEVNQVVQELLEGGPEITKKIKEMIDYVGSHNPTEGLDFVKKVFAFMMKSEEARYGMMSFIQKKKPDWNQFYQSKL